MERGILYSKYFKGVHFVEIMLGMIMITCIIGIKDIIIREFTFLKIYQILKLLITHIKQ